MKEILTGDYRLVKHLNSSVILNLIRTRSLISGADLAKITKMRPSTIMKILKNLERKGLIVKAGIGNSTHLGGRRPTLWEICGSYGYVVGLQLELNEIHAVLLDLNSKIIEEKDIRIRRLNSISDIENKIIEIIDDLLYAKKISRRHLLGLGIGVSGLVDIKTGAIIKTSLLPRKDQPILLEDALKKHYDFPVYIENDANTAVLSEKWFGQAKGVNQVVFTLVVVDVDVFGIGFGLILDNRIYRGANMFAGETNPFSHNLRSFLRQCPAGHSGDKITLGGKQMAIEDVDLSILLELVKSEDKMALCIFEQMGQIIGKELTYVMNLLDPDMVIIGGEIAKAKEYIIDPISATLDKELVSDIKRNFKIVASSLPGYSVPLGAASLILQRIFQEPVVGTKEV